MIKVEEKRRRIEASFFDDLLKALSKSMLNGFAERVEEGARTLLGRSLQQLAFMAIATGITIAAGVLVLVAGVQGLEQASVPPSLAYLIAGIVGISVGITMLLLRR